MGCAGGLNEQGPRAGLHELEYGEHEEHAEHEHEEHEPDSAVKFVIKRNIIIKRVK